MRVGLDIGGTKTDAVLMSPESGIVAQLRLPTGYGANEVVDTALAAITQLAEKAHCQPWQFESIGIGIPGVVDTATGRVSHAVNLGLAELDLGAQLAALVGAPVRVENDVKAAALGVFHLLSQHNISSMAYLNLGTGLAAGLVLNGKLVRGAHGAAGEIGHIPVDPHGPVCSCGQRGCLELMASGSAIARQWPTNDPSPAAALFEAADAGDIRAIAVQSSLVTNIAAAVRILVLTVDVDTVVIGGGMSSIGDQLLPSVRSVLSGWAAESPFLASLDLGDRVQILQQGYPAAAVGAALVGAAKSPVG